MLASGERADASARLHDALALWRGPALADLTYADFAQGAIARLEEIRLAALELRIETDLSLGRHRELVAELQGHVAEHPLRERLVACLMLALHQSGQQADALATYRQARQTLVEALGIEPDVALQELERAILCQDPALHPAATSGASVATVAERSILVAVGDETRIDALLAMAEALVRQPPRVLIVARLVSDAAELAASTSWLSSAGRSWPLAASSPVRRHSRRRHRARTWRDSPPARRRPPAGGRARSAPGRGRARCATRRHAGRVAL